MPPSCKDGGSGETKGVEADGPPQVIPDWVPPSSHNGTPQASLQVQFKRRRVGNGCARPWAVNVRRPRVEVGFLGNAVAPCQDVRRSLSTSSQYFTGQKSRWGWRANPGGRMRLVHVKCCPRVHLGSPGNSGCLPQSKGCEGFYRLVLHEWSSSLEQSWDTLQNTPPLHTHHRQWREPQLVSVAHLSRIL